MSRIVLSSAGERQPPSLDPDRGFLSVSEREAAGDWPGFGLTLARGFAAEDASRTVI